MKINTKSCDICGKNFTPLYAFDLSGLRRDMSKKFVPVVWVNYPKEGGIAHSKCTLTEIRKYAKK